MLTLLLVLPALAMEPPEVAAAEPVAVDMPALRLATGALVEPTLGLVLLSIPQGGIDAVDLSTGQPRWHRDDATVAIAAAGGELGVWDGREQSRDGLHLLILDAHDGSTISTCPAVALPAWASTLPGDHTVAWTQVQGQLTDGDLLISWQASHWFHGGARTRPGQRPLAQASEAGTARCHAGTLIPVEGEISAVPVVTIPGGQIQVIDGRVMVLDEAGAVQWTRELAKLDAAGE